MYLCLALVTVSIASQILSKDVEGRRKLPSYSIGRDQIGRRAESESRNRFELHFEIGCVDLGNAIVTTRIFRVESSSGLAQVCRASRAGFS